MRTLRDCVEAHFRIIPVGFVMIDRCRVLLVGAYERDNFGDLLFLLVTERYLRGRRRGRRRALQRRHAGPARPPDPGLRAAARAESFDAIWTVGGQVGRVDVRARLQDVGEAARVAPVRRRSDAARARILRRAAGGAPPRPPYIPLPAAYPRNAGAPAVLNSVGIAGVRGIEPGRREAVVAALRGAAAVSVRDQGSSRLLSDLGVEHRLLPDAVHALGVLDPAERDPRADAAIVQISSARLRMLGHARVARALARSPQLAGRPVHLLLAGTATGHDAVRDYEPSSAPQAAPRRRDPRERRPWSWSTTSGARGS